MDGLILLFIGMLRPTWKGVAGIFTQIGRWGWFAVHHQPKLCFLLQLAVHHQPELSFLLQLVVGVVT